MRALLVVALVAFGCAKPARKKWTDSLASVGQRLVAVVKSGAVKVDANAAAKAAAQTPPPAPPPAQQQQQQQQQQQREPDPAPPPDVQITRTNAARPTQFVMRGELHDGKDFCEAFTTMEACTSACTNKLRPSMLTKPGPDAPKGCACNEQDTGC